MRSKPKVNPPIPACLTAKVALFFHKNLLSTILFKLQSFKEKVSFLQIIEQAGVIRPSLQYFIILSHPKNYVHYLIFTLKICPPLLATTIESLKIAGDASMLDPRFILFMTSPVFPFNKYIVPIESH